METEKIVLIDKEALVAALVKSGCAEKLVLDIVDAQKVIAVARHKYEVEVFF